MIRFDMIPQMSLKSWAWLEFQQKDGICHQSLTPPPHVIMSSHVIFWPTPPSSDDVIYEQPLREPGEYYRVSQKKQKNV